MILVNDRTFGTAFQIDPHGGFLTSASLISGSQQLRLVDNTGGSHAVRVVGVDPALELAEVRADVLGLPIAFGVSGSIKTGDPLVLLASAKVIEPAHCDPGRGDRDHGGQPQYSGRRPSGRRWRPARRTGRHGAWTLYSARGSPAHRRGAVGPPRVARTGRDADAARIASGRPRPTRH